MCAHLIEELSPLLDAPIEVDASISKQWLDIAVALEQDAVAYQAVPDAVFATELLGVADAAYDIAVVNDPGGQSTSQALDEASITLTRQVRQLGGALPEETCTDHDRGAQSMLRNALVAAKVAYTDAGTYDSVTVEDLSMIEPSFPFAGDVPATVDAVSVNLLSGKEVVLSLASESGRTFCIGDSPDGTFYGTMDAVGATSVVDCGDTKPWPD